MTTPPPGPRQEGRYPADHDPSLWARPDGPPPTEPPTRRIAAQPNPVRTPVPHARPQSYPGTTTKESKLRRFVKDPLSVVLILVIVLALGIAALLGGELYARHRGNSVVAKVVECVVRDKADASFGVVPPFLWQHVNRRYTNLSIETAGNQVLDAKGMKLNIDIKDVHLQQSADSAGTIGSLVATVTWTADGIKETVQNAIPVFGGIVSGVTTNAAYGTIELDGPLGHVSAKPVVTNGALNLAVQKVTGLGFTLPRESVQPALDAFTTHLIDDLPMGIKADSVQVTDDGVTSQFSTQNATIPLDDQDPCFAGL